VCFVLSIERVSESPVRVSRQYRVRYQRNGWTQYQQRIFSSQKKAQDFLDKLENRTEKLTPLLWVALDRREVPPWQSYRQWDFAE
jgi:hypothetical protein